MLIENIIGHLYNNEILRYSFYFVIFVFFLRFALLLFKFVSKPSFHPYRSIPLFSKAEHSFFIVLQQVIPTYCILLAKVRIADVLTPVKGLGNKSWYSAFSKISSKHFDYVICDSETLEVLAVVELDDKSHRSFKVKKRDAFVEKACEVADLELLRFKCARNYNIDVIRECIEDAL